MEPEYKDFTEEDVVRLAEKGRHLLRWISQTAEEATADMSRYYNRPFESQSIFTRPSKLRRNGWDNHRAPRSWQTWAWADENPEDAMHALGLSPRMNLVGEFKSKTEPDKDKDKDRGDQPTEQMESGRQVLPRADTDDSDLVSSTADEDAESSAVAWRHVNDKVLGNPPQTYYASAISC